MGGPSSSGKGGGGGGASSVDYKTAGSSESEQVALHASVNDTNWQSNLKSYETGAISAYSGSAYSNMNDYLRGIDKNTTDIVKSRIKYVQNAISKNGGLKENVMTYRGATIAALGLGSNPSHETIMGLKGATVADKGFMSTTTNKNKSFSGGIKMVIKAPKGSNAASIKNLSKFTYEQEILFNAGTKMKVTKVVATGDKYHPSYEFHVTVLK